MKTDCGWLLPGEALAEDFTECILPQLAAEAGAGRACSALRLSVGDMFTHTDWVQVTSNAWPRREKSTLKNFALRSQADFIYTCTMMFGPELMREMAALAEGMRPGAVFVTVMLPLPSDAFEVVCTEPCLFSWGEVEVVVHRRKPRDG